MACQCELHEHNSISRPYPDIASVLEAQLRQFLPVLFKASMNMGGGMHLTETSVRIESLDLKCNLISARIRYADR